MIQGNMQNHLIRILKPWNPESPGQAFYKVRNHSCQSILYYPEKSINHVHMERGKAKPKTFHDKTELNQFVSTNPGIQNVLPGKLEFE